jgi:hypothetical protein
MTTRQSLNEITSPKDGTPFSGLTANGKERTHPGPKMAGGTVLFLLNLEMREVGQEPTPPF